MNTGIINEPNSITDNPIQTTATYNKGETYETKYDDPVDDTVKLIK